MATVSAGERPRPKVPVEVVLFTAAYLVPAIATAVSTQNGEFVFYCAVMLILAAIVASVHRRCGLSHGVLWGLSVWGLAHMVGGLVPVPDSWPVNGPIRVVYSLWLIPDYLKYDHVVHGLGFFVTAILFWQVLARIVGELHPGRPLTPTLGVLVVCAAASTGLGALNEVIEFTATLLVPETNVGGYINTGWDLVSNLIGAVLAAVWLRLTARGHSPATIENVHGH